MALADTFNKLSGFEDHVYIFNNGTTREVRGLTSALVDDLEEPVGRIIIVFCEAMRFRTLYVLAHAGLGNYVYSSPLTSQHWNLIRSWGKISEYVLKMRKRRNMDLDSLLDPDDKDLNSHGFPTGTLRDLIGPNGVLTLCKIIRGQIITDNNLRRRSAEKGRRTNFPEPNLVRPGAEAGAEAAEAEGEEDE